MSGFDLLNLPACVGKLYSAHISLNKHLHLIALLDLVLLEQQSFSLLLKLCISSFTKDFHRASSIAHSFKFVNLSLKEVRKLWQTQLNISFKDG